MKYFKTTQGKIKGVDTNQEFLIQSDWQELTDAELAVEIAPPPLTRNDIEHIRRGAYQQRSDPLYMQWQYDQTPEAEQRWRAEVAAIKQEYPWPV